jgi:integrase
MFTLSKRPLSYALPFIDIRPHPRRCVGTNVGTSIIGKLNPTQVKTLKEPGRYVDGKGLILEVKPGGSKSWVARLQRNGRRRDYGLGSLHDVSLSEARDKAWEYRRLLRSGLDPLEVKKSRIRIPTFREAAEAVHEENCGSWKNAKHRDQWLSSLERYAFPRFGSVAIDEVGTNHVRDALVEIWLAKPETARRVRQRIATVLDYAVAKQWRNASISMSAVNKALPKQTRNSGHFAAMPYQQLPKLLRTLSLRQSMANLALQALILTAARSGEIRGARWGEVDLEAATWTIPGERMKAGKTHVIPLSTDAALVFRTALELRRDGSDLVFYGLKRGRPLSDMTLLKVLRSLKLPFTVHGFRSSFRDWVAEQTEFSGEVAEAALAHTVPNQVEAAYRRTDFLEKRRLLMQRWADFLWRSPNWDCS